MPSQDSQTNFALMRERILATQGKQYWRSLEELADSDEFQEFIAREYGIAPELARGTYEKVARVLSRDGTTAPELIREEIEDNKERLGVSMDVPVAQVADFTLLQQTQRELGPR